MLGVAIVRGKGIPAWSFRQEPFESRAEFVTRVVNVFSKEDELSQRNTLTLEFVWNSN